MPRLSITAQLLFILLPIAALIGVVGVALVVARKHKLRGWAEAAARLGLDHHGDSMSGMLEGCEVAARWVPRGHRNRRQVITTLRVKLADAPPDLHICREGALDAALTLAGGQDLQTGDAAFDQLLRIRAQDPDAALRYLAPPHRRSALLTLHPTSPGWWIEGGHLQLNARGLLSGEQVEQRLRALVHAANHHTHG